MKIFKEYIADSGEIIESIGIAQGYQSFEFYFYLRISR